VLRPKHISGIAPRRLVRPSYILITFAFGHKCVQVPQIRRLSRLNDAQDSRFKDSKMVTGIELAGVILAILPLVISATEHYEATYSILLDWKQFRSEYGMFRDKLELQNIRFRLLIEPVLRSTTTSEKTFHEMLKDETHSEWENPKLAERLKMELSLPSDFEVFCSCMSTIKKELDKVKKALDTFHVVGLISRRSRLSYLTCSTEGSKIRECAGRFRKAPVLLQEEAA
jgi:hypothetical protein